MSLVVALADAGRTADALDEAERARPLLKGADLSRLLAQRALVLQRIGRYEDALACYRQSLPGLRRDGDSLWEARLLGNRGPMRAYLGDHRGAVNDLKRCAAVAEANGLWNQLARAWQNLGFAMSLVGDVPAALELLDNAAEVGQQRGFDDSSLVLDRAEALLAAGLGSEAADWASTALLGLDERGLAYDAAEARLLFARAALSAGRPQDARAAAERAATEFAQQRRPAWTRLARQVSVLARWDAGERGAALTRAARITADDCAAAGWTVASLSARFVAARSALESSSLTTARTLLADVAVARGSGSAEARATGWHAEALLRLANHDRRGAERALRRALAVRADNAAALGATDLRAHAAVFGEELASTGLRLAVEDRRPAGRARVGRALARQRSAEPAGPPAQRRRAGHRARSPARRHGSPARGAARRAARHRAAPAAAHAGVGRPGAGPARPRLVGFASRRRRLRREVPGRPARRAGPGRARPQRQRPARRHRGERSRGHARPVPVRRGHHRDHRAAVRADPVVALDRVAPGARARRPRS